MRANQSQALAKAVAALTLISASRRPDGTYNRCREACESLARQTLQEIDKLGMSVYDMDPPEDVLNLSTTTLPPPKPPQGMVAVPQLPEGPTGAAGALEHLTPSPRVAGGTDFTVWSDGCSKGNPGKSAWGIAVKVGDTLVQAEGGYLGIQTNQVAELIAALEALRRLPLGAKVLLISDSQYTLNGLMSWRKGWERNGWLTSDKQPVKNKEIWQALSKEADLRQVTTKWVRGHDGDEMNELCDELANAAVVALGPVVRL